MSDSLVVLLWNFVTYHTKLLKTTGRHPLRVSLHQVSLIFDFMRVHPPRLGNNSLTRLVASIFRELFRAVRFCLQDTGPSSVSTLHEQATATRVCFYTDHVARASKDESVLTTLLFSLNGISLCLALLLPLLPCNCVWKIVFDTHAVSDFCTISYKLSQKYVNKNMCSQRILDSLD